MPPSSFFDGDADNDDTDEDGDDDADDDGDDDADDDGDDDADNDGDDIDALVLKNSLAFESRLAMTAPIVPVTRNLLIKNQSAHL